MVEIKHTNGTVLLSADVESISNAVDIAARSRIDLTGANLFRADLSCCRISRRWLVEADLSYASLDEGNLERTRFNGARLVMATLVGAKARGAIFTDANLQGADMRKIDLFRSDLNGADLRGANLRNADLRGANLRDADLRDASLCEADLTGILLDGSALNGVNIRDAILHNTGLCDAGHDSRGHRFWAWLRQDGAVIYRAGYREWDSIEAARAYYGEAYYSDGDAETCLARLNVLHAEAVARGWIR